MKQGLVKRPAAARDRILDAAERLFYARGVNNVGIDLVIARSGVAKMTLYHHFRSKDDLVVAFLDRTRRTWLAWLARRVEEVAPDPRDRPLAVFVALEEWFRSRDFRGCPFINTAAEVADPRHPAHRAALEFKNELRAMLARLARAASRPGRAADALLILADGAIVRAALTGDPRAARTAREAAAAVLGRKRGRTGSGKRL